MYILIVDYIKPAEAVNPFVEPHSQWVKKYFEEGILLFAGPKKSKLGGVILATSIDKKKLMAILAEDPYVMEDVATYLVVEFDCKLAIPALESLKSQ